MNQLTLLGLRLYLGASTELSLETTSCDLATAWGKGATSSLGGMPSTELGGCCGLPLKFLKNFLSLHGMDFLDKHVCTIANRFHLIGAPLSILGAKISISLGHEEAVFLCIGLHIDIRQVSITSMWGRLLEVYPAVPLEVSISWSSPVCFAVV